MIVRFTRQSWSIYQAALSYLDERNPFAAEQLMLRVERAIDRLESFPRIGHYIPEFPDEPFREVIVDPYRFFYCIDGDTVWIVGVWHGRQIPAPPSLR